MSQVNFPDPSILTPLFSFLMLMTLQVIHAVLVTSFTAQAMHDLVTILDSQLV